MEKLTDYQEKMLAIHNAIYRIKSVVTGHEIIENTVKGK